MYTYMEYLQKCFYRTTNWNEDNVFSNITATSQALLEFGVPNGCKVDISSKSSNYSASSFTLSNYHSINGSLAYLYSSTPLRNTSCTKDMSLQDAISGFRIIEPFKPLGPLDKHNFKKGTLLYGRMYFPGTALEAMFIKRFSQSVQLLIKCISNLATDKNSTMIVYLQKNTPRYSREFIYSTNEAMFGFRFLYNFGKVSEISKSSKMIIPKFENSVISFGTEIWYAAMSMSPALSTAFRYSTRSTSTGKPLTMTIACNPLLGQISSDYTVRTSVASTFSSRYDFNFYSYDSDLSLGFETFNYEKNKSNLFNNMNAIEHHNYQKRDIKHNFTPFHDIHEHNNINVNLPAELSSHHSEQGHSLIGTPETKGMQYTYSDVCSVDKGISKRRDETAVSAFKTLVNDSDFSSAFKVSTSLGNKVLRVLWEGKFKEFLVSTGVKVSLHPLNNTLSFDRFGISFSYAC